MLSSLHISPMLLLLGIALLIVLIVVLMLVVLWRMKKKQESSEAQQEQTEEAAQDEKSAFIQKPLELETRRSVSSALRFISRNSTGGGSRYRSPWFMVLGASGSGKSTLLENSGISLSLREGAADFGVHHGIKWRFFDAGVILDVPGDFLLGADQIASDERKWKSLLRNLVRYRPQRPIDGVVLTIPATELIGDAAIAPAMMGQRGAHIFDKLWQLQKWTGLCFPVYVLITKCDIIPGFKGLASQLPSHYQHEIFGWSNPYNLEAAFDTTWVDQGFEEMARELNRLQSEIFVERNDIADVDNLFLLSGKLQELRRPLRIYLNQIFKKSAYRESLQFRGFYFTGDGSDTQEEPAAAKPVRALAATAGAGTSYALTAPGALKSSDHSAREELITGEVLGISPAVREETQHKPLFVADLFESKIFPERGLAHPSAKVYLSRNRTVAGMQIACLVTILVLTVGVWINYRRFDESRRITVPMLDQIVADLRESRATDSAHVSEQEKDTAFNLIHVMEKLTGRRFKSLFFPTSFVAALDEQVKHAMVPAFERLVYSTFRRELEHNKEHLFMDLIQAGDQNENASPLPVTSVQHTLMYRRLHKYSIDLLLLEQNIANYNDLATHGTGDPQSLIALESYLHGHNLPSSFDYEGNPYFREALQQAAGERIEITAEDRRLASEKLRRLAGRLFDQWMANNDLIGYLEGLRKKIDALDHQELQSYEGLNDLKNSLEQTQAIVNNPDLLWMANRKLALSGTINDVTKNLIQRSQYLSPKPQLEDYVDQAADQNFEILQAKLRAQRTNLTGQIVTLDNNLVRLSPEAGSLRALLQNLLDLPFVKREGTEQIRTRLSPDERLFWSKDDLQEAISLQDSYNRFQREELDSAPVTLRSTFEEVALTRLEDNMADLIARAQTFTPASPSSDPDERIASEVQNFQEASESLGTLLNDLRGLELTDTRQELLQITTSQAANLLMKIDESFEAQSPYATSGSNFERWTGENTPTRAGFDAHNPDELLQYIAFQRQQVQQYAAKAAPLVSFLDGRVPSGGKEPGRTFLKWQRIVSDLQKYQAKVPGTSLAALEDFIGAEMDKAAPENCQASFLSASASPAGDYFVQAREALRRSLYGRCRALSEENAVRAYTRLAKLFNERLAGKFPFSVPPQEQLPSEADPQDVAELFRLLDKDGKIIHLGLQNGNFGNSYSRVLAFLNQVEALRPLFGSLFVAEGDAVPVLDFVPAFRVNQARELNGNQIIDWTLQVGTDVFRYHDPQRTGRWNFGDPVKLTLRWAKDSPDQPATGASTDARLNSRTVTFEYRDAWSLFSMLTLHQPSPNDFDRMTDPDPQTLVFSVFESKNATTTAQKPDTTPQTKVFIRVKLRPPGKPDNLRLRSFPTEAPGLEQGSMQARTDAGGNQ